MNSSSWFLLILLNIIYSCLAEGQKLIPQSGVLEEIFDFFDIVH